MASMPSEPLQPQSVDGVAVGRFIAPDSAQAIAAQLAEAANLGQTVIPVGGGTALGLGNAPRSADIALSTRALSAIIDYEPTDLVLSVGAGARFGDVQAALGEHGQRLPLDPAGGDDATIGGLIATARWGPLRHSAGTLRDLLIGITVAHPGGTVSKAGGMVVKNVTGYDMPRLYHGSLGTLGVITSANFKVLPRPRAEATVLATAPTVSEAFSIAALMRDSGDPTAALEVSTDGDAWRVATRIEGRERTVGAIAQRLALLGGETTTLAEDDSAAWWQDHVASFDPAAHPDAVTLRLGIRPRATRAMIEGLLPVLAAAGATVSGVSASPGVGSALVRLDLGNDGARILPEVQRVALDLAESAVILNAPSAWKQGLDVWGAPPAGIEVMTEIREQFDPQRVINPGRFAGFL
ncbi:MAG: FAD-binding protein [Thermomicrobiales bacterium]